MKTRTVTIKIRTPYENESPHEVRAYDTDTPGLVVHRDVLGTSANWKVSHEGTGYIVYEEKRNLLTTRRDALEFAKRLGEPFVNGLAVPVKFDWTSNPKEWHWSLSSKAGQFCRETYQNVTDKISI